MTCERNSKFKYLFNIDDISNCVEECPDTTILNEADNQCIKIKKIIIMIEEIKYQ